MEFLKTLKPIRIAGEILQPSETIKTLDAQTLIDKGYARKLTVEEKQAILASYVTYAKKLFAERSVRALCPQKKRTTRLQQQRLWDR